MIWLIAFILLFIITIIVVWKYLSLVGNVQEKAREIFDRWRERELEKMSNEKAEILFEKWKKEYEDEIRKDAIEKSKSVITGKVTEHFAPYLPQFNYNPKDVRFIGSPIDLIVFDGLDEGDLRKVIFIEVKSGKSTLNKRERMIRDIIERRKVKWELLRI